MGCGVSNPIHTVDSHLQANRQVDVVSEVKSPVNPNIETISGQVSPARPNNNAGTSELPIDSYRPVDTYEKFGNAKEDSEVCFEAAGKEIEREASHSDFGLPNPHKTEKTAAKLAEAEKNTAKPQTEMRESKPPHVISLQEALNAVNGSRVESASVTPVPIEIEVQTRTKREMVDDLLGEVLEAV